MIWMVSHLTPIQLYRSSHSTVPSGSLGHPPMSKPWSWWIPISQILGPSSWLRPWLHRERKGKPPAFEAKMDHSWPFMTIQFLQFQNASFWASMSWDKYRFLAFCRCIDRYQQICDQETAMPVLWSSVHAPIVKAMKVNRKVTHLALRSTLAIEHWRRWIQNKWRLFRKDWKTGNPSTPGLYLQETTEKKSARFKHLDHFDMPRVPNIQYQRFIHAFFCTQIIQVNSKSSDTMVTWGSVQTKEPHRQTRGLGDGGPLQRCLGKFGHEFQWGWRARCGRMGWGKRCAYPMYMYMYMYIYIKYIYKYIIFIYIYIWNMWLM